MNNLLHLALASTATVILACGAATADVRVKDVRIQLISQVDHKVFDPERVPEDHGYPYGMDLEVMVSVRLSAKSGDDRALKLAVSAVTAGYESEATGKVAAVKQSATRQVYPSNEGDRWYHFVFESVCDTLTVTAKAGNSKKVAKAELACAE
jgi:hypothetical protein